MPSKNEMMNDLFGGPAAAPANRRIVVHVEVRRVYGKLACYPLSDDAKAFARLIGTATLSAGNLLAIRKDFGADMAFDGAKSEVDLLVADMRRVNGEPA